MAKEIENPAEQLENSAGKQPVTGAEEKQTAANTEKAEKKQKEKIPQASVYPVSELAANAKNIFNTMPECVTAALKIAGKQEYTVAEAKGIVERFLKKEVK